MCRFLLTLTLEVLISRVCQNRQIKAVLVSPWRHNTQIKMTLFLISSQKRHSCVSLKRLPCDRTLHRVSTSWFEFQIRI
ncbi:hypothetical protein M758_9G052900 [Ceratodon purpureus]|nr:hypothetical protein M758_9G052900 [Ceratodon purpureus]